MIFLNCACRVDDREPALVPRTHGDRRLFVPLHVQAQTAPEEQSAFIAEMLLRLETLPVQKR